MMANRLSRLVGRRSAVLAIVVVIAALFFLPGLWESNSREKPLRSYAIDVSRYGKDGDKVVCNLLKDDQAGWDRRRKKAVEQAAFQIQTYDTWGEYFFQSNWEPTVACEYERRMGQPGDGGKWICNPEDIKKPALIYSLGSSNDYAFEESMHAFFGPQTEIHTFDFGTPIGTPSFVNYHQYKITSEDGPGARTLKTIIKELGHEKRTIDILKMDIEGYEYDALISALKDGVFAQVDQLQIEVHLTHDLLGRLPLMSPNRVHDLFLRLNRENMEIFHKEPNTSGTRGGACEFSFVKVRWSGNNK